MTRRNLWVGLGALVLGGIAWALFASRRNTPASALPATKASAMNSMPGMEDMQASSNGSARLTASQIRQFGVTFGTVDVRRLTTTTRTTGVVAVDETRLVQVAPKFRGFVERLYVNATGQPVQRGPALLDVFSPELLAGQQELLLAGRLQVAVGPR